MPLLTLDHIHHAFGHLPLLDDVSLQLEPRERVSVIGRNGSGKSTLLQILSGEVAPDSGAVWHQPALRVARLVQDVPLTSTQSIFEVVAEGLGPLHGHDTDDWRREHKVDLVLSRLDLDGEARVDTLSGGWRRRVLLARALVAEPDVLLLDEPTNHLDVDAISWLENFLADYKGAVVFVTHDRAFLQRLATRIVELDRGRLTSWPGDYTTFVQKKEEWLANEAVQQEKFDKRLAQEEVWIRQGIKARRTRDEGRVKALLEMRRERAARRDVQGNVSLKIDRADSSGKMVFEAEHLRKVYGDRVVVDDFSTRIMRGDRVGLIGPNGAGKTTLLRLLLEQIAPDAGTMRHGANVQIAYFDQQREQLDPERTVFDTVGEGNDTVTVNGQVRHVHGYLRDFLFGPERARSPVKALSGGERNRLLLARLFTRPANVLVMDEPTNDLDLETLELLEAQLVEWPGTLLLVSHDRVFLDNVVTSTVVFEGEGRLEEYVGGYADWLRQRRKRSATAGRGQTPGSDPAAGGPSGENDRGQTPGSDPVAAVASPRAATTLKKLSYKEQRELETLPHRIEALESELGQLQASIAAPDFYKERAEGIASSLARAGEVEQALLDAYARWDELDARR
ncbi:MAG TPA: ATP-binding cassette domain-containing protein [Vicinamibacterales bacterium]|nr:ATP-binding cassette domain-containing protein [Vicinamibacterales bacterium]